MESFDEEMLAAQEVDSGWSFYDEEESGMEPSSPSYASTCNQGDDEGLFMETTAEYFADDDDTVAEHQSTLQLNLILSISDGQLLDPKQKFQIPILAIQEIADAMFMECCDSDSNSNNSGNNSSNSSSSSSSYSVTQVSLDEIELFPQEFQEVSSGGVHLEEIQDEENQ